MECYSVSCENATRCALLTAFSFLPTVSKCFLRGMPWLCKYMPKPKNARLLIPDPEHEPDFYTLSRLFPLPHQAPDKIVPPLSSQEAFVVDPVGSVGILIHYKVCVCSGSSCRVWADKDSVATTHDLHGCSRCAVQHSRLAASQCWLEFHSPCRSTPAHAGIRSQGRTRQTVQKSLAIRCTLWWPRPKQWTPQ